MQTPLLLLHGAVGSAGQLTGLSDVLSGKQDVHRFDFPGHGGKQIPAAGFAIDVFARSVLELIEKNNWDRIHIFGYSMGGYVALFLARHYPERVGRIITLGTKFRWDEQTAAKEVKMLDADTVAAKVPAFAGDLERRHAPNDWREVLARTADMLVKMGGDNPLKPDDYKTIQSPSLIMLGDRDKMVSLDETVDVYRSLPGAQLAVLPATPHPIEQVNRDQVCFFIDNFLR